MENLSHLEDHVGYWMRIVSNHISSSFKKKLEEHEVGVAEWVVMRHLYDQEGLSPSTLAEMTGMTRGAISKLLDRIFHKKLIERVESSQDRRFQEVKLSRKGRQLLPKLVALADENDQQFFGHLSDQQKQHLIQILKEIVDINHLNQAPII
jgi:DNA-binding MarR family transcriptional regulator